MDPCTNSSHRIGAFAPTGAMVAQDGVTLGGIVEDQTGAVIPDEKLTLLNKATGEARKAKSDDSGHFSFSDQARTVQLSFKYSF